MPVAVCPVLTRGAAAEGSPVESVYAGSTDRGERTEADSPSHVQRAGSDRPPTDAGKLVR